MRRYLIVLMSVLLVAGTVIVFWGIRGLSDFDLTGRNINEVSFEFEDSAFSGTLVMPNDANNPPIALVVHGDGAQDRFSNGGYLPLISTLVDAGIGVFTWDKAGVGESTGNWLDQTMDDRADEALAALHAISALDDIDIGQIGFLGFSQAGWVLPRVASQTTPAFTVIIGGAVSWRDQGSYYSRVRMISEGLRSEEIERHLVDRTLRNDALFNDPAAEQLPKDMDPARFRFVAAAYSENSTDMIGGMRGPILAIWGEDDLNVDAHSDSAIFQEQLTPLAVNQRVMMIPNATHGLLRADLYNYQLPSDWPWYLQYIFMGMGRDAFAQHSLEQIAVWIHASVENQDQMHGGKL